MHLDPEARAMLAGELGEPRRWAMQHMLDVGAMFDAEDLVEVSQAHMMADPESLGEAGVAFLESLAARPFHERQVRVPMLTDPRGVDLDRYRPLGQDESMAALERRIVAACHAMGILLTDTCINYQTIMPPVQGDHVAFGDTGVVIYSNSVLGARSNFEGGPSALAAGLTGRTPRYGLHLADARRATHRFRLRVQPRDLTEWGLLGAVIGRACGSYWAMPAIEGVERAPTSDALKHFGAAMASYGSTPLFHLVGVTPEAPSLDAVGAARLTAVDVERADLAALQAGFGAVGDAVDVVVFAAPQLSLVEMQQLSSLCAGRTRHPETALVVCTSPQVYPDAARLGFVSTLESAGALVLQGTCFYQQYAREIGVANGWSRLLSNSTKIVNILGGYGYQPALRNMAVCVDSACAGRITA